MNNQEAKFILGAYRPDGRDAGDAMFAEALAQADRDPELKAWLERERKFDTTLAGKLREVAPPAGLREAILAGGRASQPRRNWWANPAWLAAAAAAVIMVTLSLTLRQSSGAPSAAELTAFVMKDLAESHSEHVGHPAGFEGLQARLASSTLPLAAEKGLDLNLEELRQKKCRSVRIAGREVFEICFNRNGVWYHLYAASRSDFAPGALDAKSLIASRGEFVATAWADAKHVYALVTDAGQEALRRVI